MPPLRSALISPSYDEFLASLRRDLTFEELVAAMRFAQPQFPVPAPAACASPHLNSLFRLPLLVLRRLLSIALAAFRVVVSAVTVSAFMLLPLCTLMSSRMLKWLCWPLICVMSVLTGSTLLM